MQIVSQSAPLSYSVFPPRLLLTAPPPPKLLCAPKIAGLLPARVGIPHTDSILPRSFSPEDLLRELGPIRSRDEMNTELANLVLDALQFLKRSAVPPAPCAAQERIS